ncbi:hypothetical protein DFH07DRAFT_457480 [Mycena maculata]|uniref:C2H2-type domain-containing protein n=1 Tax=Mycena maculata TaxID=230809 RepID=A0AAD7J5U8_9AGAR|nr:hypothetical protein DFH07DRAFT_457480 [Mycena maculata]
MNSNALAFHDLLSSLGMTPEDIPQSTKRNGLYLTPNQHASLGIEDLELVDAKLFRQDLIDDDVSTWEFHAPVASSFSSWDSHASTCASPYQTPAQDVAFRYRAGLKVDLGERSSSPESSKANKSCMSSSDDFDYVSYLSFETASTVSSMSLSLPFHVQQELKPAFRESRANALLDIREEALAVMKADGVRDGEPVVCHRPDCRDTLPNMRALMYHLHVHNMHDRTYKCDMCSRGYETRRELTMHQCPRLAKSLPSSPIRDTFMRVLTKITSREN